MSQLEHGRREARVGLATRIAKALDLPLWYFDEALMRDSQDSRCTASEVTQVVVGLRAYAQRCTAEEWAAIRGGA